MKKIILILFLSAFSFHDTKASDDNEERPASREWRLGGMFYAGKAMNHSRLITPMIERSAAGGEIFLSKQTYGKYSWNAFFNYPEYGISYKFMDMGSPNYAGNAHCLLPYLNFHLFNNKNRVNLNLRIGAGFAYVEKIYDAITRFEAGFTGVEKPYNTNTNDTFNYAFSTHLNIALDAQLQGVCKINNMWNFIAGVGIFHISNGAYKMPNLGLNNVSFFTGFSKSFGAENRLIVSENKINKKNRNWDCSVYLLGGIKEINPIGGEKYYVGDFNVEVTKKHLQYTRFGLSLDVTHDGSEYDCIDFQSLPTVDRLKTTRIGISGGYEWMFGDFAVDLFLGTYLYEPNPLYGKIYQRTSLRYPLSDRVKLSIAFRNHKGKADFIGLGFGVRLTK